MVAVWSVVVDVEGCLEDLFCPLRRQRRLCIRDRCMRAFLRLRTHVCCACVRACVHERARVWVCECVCDCGRAVVRSCVRE